MQSGNFPDCDGEIAFAGRRSQSQSVTNTNESDTTISHKACQLFPLGNRCGHNIKSPLSFIPNSKHKNRYYILEESKRRIQRSYANRFTYKYGLSSFHRTKRTKRGALRSMRSEIRDVTHNAVIQCILHYLNLRSMIMGFYDKKSQKFINFGIQFITKKVNEGLAMSGSNQQLTYNRVRKAIKTLEKAGYISLERNNFLTENVEYRSLPAVIRVHKSIFYDLGFADDDIKKYTKEENHVAYRESLKTKATDYIKFSREKEKKLKVKLGKMRGLLIKNNDGFPLTTAEKSYLDAEYPGWQRISTKSAVYKDFTGFSEQAILKKANESYGDSTHAGAHIANILKKLHSPP